MNAEKLIKSVGELAQIKHQYDDLSGSENKFERAEAERNIPRIERLIAAIEDAIYEFKHPLIFLVFALIGNAEILI